VSAHRLWIDAQAVQSPHFERGIPRYVTALVHALHARGTDLAGVGLNPSQALPAGPHRSLLALPTTTWTTASHFRSALDAGPLIYLQASPFEGFRPVQNLWPPFVLDSGVPIVSIVYDTIPFRDPEYRVTPEERAFHEARGALVRRSDVVLAISEATGRDIADDLGIDPGRIAVIGSGVSAAFRPDSDPAASRSLLTRVLPAVRHPFVFSVCGWMERKNTDGLIRAWSRVPPELRRTHQLVITCSLRADVLARWERLLDDLDLRDDVLLTGAVDDDVLLALYRSAELFVYPSRYEGFGLPIAEAVECGTPAISSSTSSMPEVVGWEPGLFDPDDHDGIADLVVRSLTDDAYRAALDAACASARGRHTWDDVAGRLLDAVAALGPSSPAVARRPRYAVVAAEGDEVLSTVDALAEHAHVDCFVSGTRPVSTHPRVRVFPVAAFGATFEPAAYDERVYSLDATAAHVPILRHALCHPGVVCLATSALAPLYVAQAGEAADPVTAMARSLDDLYGNRIPERARRGEVLDGDLLTHLGAPCTIGVVHSARTVVVASEEDAHIVRLDAGPLDVAPPIRVGPVAAALGDLLGPSR
jgi:glycosyltransferase involved in cell wall biosynthesis